MNVHMCAKFGANRPSRLVAFPECVLRLVRLFDAVRADSRKNTPKDNIYTCTSNENSNIRPEHADINVTNFLHSNFRSVQWRARGGVNDILPAYPACVILILGQITITETLRLVRLGTAFSVHFERASLLHMPIHYPRACAL